MRTNTNSNFFYPQDYNMIDTLQADHG